MTVEDKKAKIRGVVEELKARSVSHETFRPYHEKVRTALQTIDAQIESIEEQYRRAVGDVEELEEDDQVKKGHNDQSFYPHRYVEALKEKFALQEQFVTWSGVAQHISRIAVEKYAEALSESRALDIERDAMKRFAEYQQRQENFHQKLIEDRLRVLEDAQRREIDWFKKEVIGALTDLYREMNAGKSGVVDEKSLKQRFERTPPPPVIKPVVVEAPESTPASSSGPDPFGELPKHNGASKARAKLDTLGFSEDDE
jgi:hypothetical protein